VLIEVAAAANDTDLSLDPLVDLGRGVDRVRARPLVCGRDGAAGLVGLLTENP
jgi:hypothetical protein